MLKIKFYLTADENTTFDPELIAALKAADESTDLSPLYKKYGENEVIEAMYSIADVPPIGEDDIEEWLWPYFYEECVPAIEEVFLKRHKSE